MRALPIVSSLVLSLAALAAACSAQPEGTPPRTGGGAGATQGSAGAVNGFAGSPGAGGAGTGFAGSPGASGSSNGFAGSPASGGATGAAGGGTVGVGCAMTKVGLGIDGMVDNFEMHPDNALIPAADGRVGGWWISVAQGTGMVTTPMITSAGGGPKPVTGGMGGGMALHFAGKDSDPIKGWGADASVAISGMGNCYDASIYTGGLKLSLMGKGSVYVSVITAQDKAMSMTSGNQRKEIAISSTWTDYPIAWSELVTGWGNPIPLDPKSIVALDIAPSAASAIDFDIWVDNVQFVK